MVAPSRLSQHFLDQLAPAPADFQPITLATAADRPVISLLAKYPHAQVEKNKIAKLFQRMTQLKTEIQKEPGLEVRGDRVNIVIDKSRKILTMIVNYQDWWDQQIAQRSILEKLASPFMSPTEFRRKLSARFEALLDKLRTRVFGEDWHWVQFLTYPKERKIGLICGVKDCFAKSKAKVS